MIRRCRFCGSSCDEHHRDRKLLRYAEDALEALQGLRARYSADLERNLGGRSTVYGQTAEQTAGAVRRCIESCDEQIAEKKAWIETLRGRLPRTP